MNGKAWKTLTTVFLLWVLIQPPTVAQIPNPATGSRDELCPFIKNALSKLEEHRRIWCPVLSVFVLSDTNAEAIFVYRENGMFQTIDSKGKAKELQASLRTQIDSVFAQASVTDRDVVILLSRGSVNCGDLKTGVIIYTAFVHYLKHRKEADLKKVLLIAFDRYPTYLYPDTVAEFDLNKVMRVEEYSKSASTERALVRLSKDITADSCNIKAYLERAEMRLKNREWWNAIDDFTLALNHCGRADTAYLRSISPRIVELRLQKGDTLGAIADLGRMVAAFPTDVRGYRTRGDLFASHRDFKQALGDYEMMTNLTPLSPEGFELAGRMRSMLGDDRGAVRNFRKAIELDPEIDLDEFSHKYHTRLKMTLQMEGTIESVSEGFSVGAMGLSQTNSIYFALAEYPKLSLRSDCEQALKWGFLERIPQNRKELRIVCVGRYARFCIQVDGSGGTPDVIQGLFISH
jgi:tetratricopeptide (TPR) repeat protein